MRLRCGSRVKVTIAVRWLHSWVTSKIPITGRRKPCGVPVNPMKLPKVRSFWSAANPKIVTAMTVIATMAIISHMPARVSTILRISTLTSVAIEGRVDPVRSRPAYAGAAVVVVITGLLRGCWLRC